MAISDLVTNGSTRVCIARFPQLSIMIIYNCTWSILIQQIRIILSADNLTQKIQKKAYFLFAINLITISKKMCRLGRSLTICGTIHWAVEWTVPQLSVMIIYNSTWSILIQQIRIILSGDNLTQKTQKKEPFTSLHKIKANLPHWAEFEILRNGALIHVVSRYG